jgi:hypothetical protein
MHIDLNLPKLDESLLQIIATNLLGVATQNATQQFQSHY